MKAEEITSSANVRTGENAAAVCCEKSSELGEIKIHDNVLAALVSKAVLAVDGVTRLAGSSLVDNLVGIIGSHSRSISIVKLEDKPGQLEIEVKINLRFGVKVPDVAFAVQRAVVEAIESATGITVSSVNVLVQQLEDQSAAAEDDAAADGADNAALR